MLKDLYRYRVFAAGRDAPVLAQSFGDVVEVALHPLGILSAPRLGNVPLIKASGS